MVGRTKIKCGFAGAIKTQQRKCSIYDADINGGRREAESGCNARRPGRKSAAIVQNARIAFAGENNLDCELGVQPENGSDWNSRNEWRRIYSGGYIHWKRRREKIQSPDNTNMLPGLSGKQNYEFFGGRPLPRLIGSRMSPSFLSAALTFASSSSSDFTAFCNSTLRAL